LIDTPQVKQKWHFGADWAPVAQNLPSCKIPWNLTAEKGNHF
jgi:hypothetical protein